jgi:hypothetical protein
VVALGAALPAAPSASATSSCAPQGADAALAACEHASPWLHGAPARPATVHHQQLGLHSRSRCLLAAASCQRRRCEGAVCVVMCARCRGLACTCCCCTTLTAAARTAFWLARLIMAHPPAAPAPTQPHHTTPAFAHASTRQASPAHASMHHDQGAWRRPLQLLRCGAAAGAFAGGARAGAPVTCVTAQAAATRGVLHCHPQPSPPHPRPACVLLPSCRWYRRAAAAAAAMGQHVLWWLTALLVFAALLAPGNAPSVPQPAMAQPPPW